VVAADIPDLKLDSALAAPAKSRWTGTAADIANAIFDATGTGTRDLPIMADGCRFPDQSTSFMQVSETFVPLGRVGSTERPISGQTSLDEQLCCVVPGIKAVENLHNRDAI
jgi:hypothetical protein